MLKRIIKKIPYFDFFYSRIRANKSVYWKKLNKNINYSNSRPDINVLMATSLGDYEMGTLLESSLSSALRLRNSKVDVLLCDSALSGCQMSKIETISPDIMAKEGPASRCSSCINYGKNSEYFIFSDIFPIYTGGTKKIYKIENNICV